MAAGRMRSTRKLRTWMIEQVNSGKYPGLVWDDEAKTMFRIPWKHAGKQDFRKDEDAAIFKAWAEFKGKLTNGGRDDPASWKTRLRCALNKSLEFEEVLDRGQLDISEPYKVYRLVPFDEQGLMMPEKKFKQKTTRRQKRKSSESESDDSQSKRIKDEEEDDVSPLVQNPQNCQMPDFKCSVEDILLQANLPIDAEEPEQPTDTQSTEVNELRLDVWIKESMTSPPEDQESFNVAVHYLGKEVFKRQILGTDARISYSPASIVPPTPAVLTKRFPRIPLPEPTSTLPAGQNLQALQTLLPFMEKGMGLTSMSQGIYGTRFCQGRIFWTGQSTASSSLHKMERQTSVLLFSKDVFNQQLEHYRTNGGKPPKCGITLCFGEELSDSDDVSQKLIIVQISLPWAEEQVQNAKSFLQSISLLQTLASQSPHREITLNLVAVPTA